MEIYTHNITHKQRHIRWGNEDDTLDTHNTSTQIIDDIQRSYTTLSYIRW